MLRGQVALFVFRLDVRQFVPADSSGRGTQPARREWAIDRPEQLNER
jgi:hypothetical protein